MKFPRSVEYALKSLVYLTLYGGDSFVSVITLSEKLKMPKTYLSKILAELTRAKFLDAKRGLGRGYRLAQDAHRIKVDTIIKIFGQDLIWNTCFLGFQECGEHNPCPFHETYKIFKEKIRKDFVNKSIKQIAANGWPQDMQNSIR